MFVDPVVFEGFQILLSWESLYLMKRCSARTPSLYITHILWLAPWCQIVRLIYWDQQDVMWLWLKRSWICHFVCSSRKKAEWLLTGLPCQAGRSSIWILQLQSSRAKLPFSAFNWFWRVTANLIIRQHLPSTPNCRPTVFRPKTPHSTHRNLLIIVKPTPILRLINLHSYLSSVHVRYMITEAFL